MQKVFITIVSLAVLATLAGLLFIYSGIYNVAATGKDSSLISWILETTRERSIDKRYENVALPDKSVFQDPKTINVGFAHYNEMCVGCHGAPGLEAGEARDGLNPEPPILAHVVRNTSDKKLFWIIKNGVKFTGMPAWGPSHSDEKIWAMVAFVKALPDMSPEQYKALQNQPGMDMSDDD